jgi:hypothetical protein
MSDPRSEAALPMPALDPAALADRAAISDIVTAYATALDTRDWALFYRIFADPVTIDYRSFDPALFFTVSSRQWTDMLSRGFGGFDATQHISSNHVHELEGDAATCVSSMQASHFFVRDGETACATFFGHYVNRLIRTEAGWRLSAVTLNVTARTGDMRVFDWARERLAAASGD